MTAIIASESLLGQRPGEDRFVIKIEIGQPYKWEGTSQTEWAADITVLPLFSRPRAIHGEGSLQALCLALRMVHAELSNFQESVGKLMTAEGEKFAPSVYWGQLTPLWAQS